MVTISSAWRVNLAEMARARSSGRRAPEQTAPNFCPLKYDRWPILHSDNDDK